MKMILTSTDFLTPNSRKAIYDFLGDISNTKVLFIPNEKATLEKINSDKYYDRLVECGFKRKNIYIFNKYEPSKFINLDIDAIYVSGGNTFETLKILKDTNFDKEIINYINKEVKYIGGSAGTHIVTKNIEHVLPFDENNTDLDSLDGLGLFDGIIFCHYTDDRKKYVDKAIEENNYNVYTLKDDEYIIIDI